MPNLKITIEFKTQSDLDWCKDRVVGAIDEVLADQADENRLDGEFTLDWDQVD
jgi:hypothetical protein